MIRLFLLSILFFSACSFKTPANKWQYDSANYFHLYTKNFLNANTILAKNDMKIAIKSAKRSANLTTLAKVHLGKCALNISVGVSDACKEYTEIKNLVNDEKLDAYYNFVTQSNVQINPALLPNDYASFAKALVKKIIN